MAYIILILFLIPVVINFVRYSFRGMNMDYCSKLDPDATIVGVHSEKDSWGKDTYIKTIVQFSDGSEYHTYYARQEPGFGHTRLIVDAEVIEKIKEKAIIAHKKKVEKESKK